MVLVRERRRKRGIKKTELAKKFAFLSKWPIIHLERTGYRHIRPALAATSIVVVTFLAGLSPQADRSLQVWQSKQS